MTNKLKPCPFCGGKAKLLKETIAVGMGATDTLYFVECTNCESSGKRFGLLDADTEKERKNLAILSWNRRVKNDR